MSLCEHCLSFGRALASIWRIRTGLPVTFFNNNNDTSPLGTIPNGINNYGVDTPDYSPGDLQINPDPRNGKPAFNTSLFNLVPALPSEIGALVFDPGLSDNAASATGVDA